MEEQSWGEEIVCIGNQTLQERRLSGQMRMWRQEAELDGSQFNKCWPNLRCHDEDDQNTNGLKKATTSWTVTRWLQA